MSKKVNPLTKKVIERINELHGIYKDYGAGYYSFHEFLVRNIKGNASNSYPPKKTTEFTQKQKDELNEFYKHVEEVEPILRVEDAERWVSISKILKKYDYNDIELYALMGAPAIKLIIDTYFKEILT